MKKVYIFLMCSLFTSFQANAVWTPPFEVLSVEAHNFGVFIQTPLTGLNSTDCDPNATYGHAGFLDENEGKKMAERALSSAYFAMASKKTVRVWITHCRGGWAIANAIWVQ